MQSNKVEQAVRDLLIAIGEDPGREGLVETPARVARFWKEFIEYDPGKTTTAFESITHSQMVAVGPMRVWSLCEHHLLPFYADVTIGYIPTNKILGLSKFARVAHQHAHALNVQEKLVVEIADTVTQLADTEDVGVIAYGEHLCMTMRGIKTPSKMVSSVMRGAFRNQAETRGEFLGLSRDLTL
ncbi:MAG: GTP cyclohydrolase I [bacterium]